MSISARLKFENDDLENANVSITFTMPLKEWRGLLQSLPSNWPSWKVAQLMSKAINDVANATAAFYTGKDVEE